MEIPGTETQELRNIMMPLLQVPGMLGTRGSSLSNLCG